MKMRRHRTGFTLLEALVALVIFGTITFALSLALSTAIRAHDASAKREADAAIVRSVFSIITRDVQGAFISKRNPASVFVANNGGTSGAGGVNAATTGSLLSLTTFAYRIQPGDLVDPATGQNADPTGMMGATSGVSGQGTVNPQADFALVRYDLDSSTNVLTRSVIPVPNIDLSRQPSGTPDAILSDRVVGLTLRFYDPTQKTWRNEWDYQQQNQGTSTEAGATDGTATDPNADPTAGAGLNPEDPSATEQQATGDTSLPSAVEITLTIMRSDKTPQIYQSMVPIIAPYLPQDPPASTGAGTTGGTMGGTNPAGGSGNGAGGANSNGTRPR
jgi:prepilin-type N-terminal cleavage/methylation domain-containing protein